MSSRKRRVRAVLARRLKRSARPVLEDLEIRLTLNAGADSTVMGPLPLHLPLSGLGGASTAPAPTLVVYHAPGSHPADDAPGPYGILPRDNGSGSPVGNGYTPQQIRTAYGIDGIAFGGIVGDGTGQTIAIVDAYDNPNLVDSSAPNFATSDLGTYISAFPSVFGPNGLTDFTFRKVGQTGGAPPTATDPTRGWEVEEALDVEMVHAIAPKATIILVEANSPSDLFTADAYAATVASVVSNSWGGGEQSGETGEDAIFKAANVTFLFSTGDNGAPGGYPAYSPYVVAVGGTSLYTNPVNDMAAETAWSTTNLLGSTGNGGGGGTSQYEPEPAYQEGVQSTGKRTIPDVSSNADPATGVAIYDAFNGGWFAVGGTSEACPVWAAQVAIANQGRALLGAPALTGWNETLPALYSLPYTDFNDVTVGTNQTTSMLDQAFQKMGSGTYSAGFQAHPGYDEATGLGSPRSSVLVPDLAAYGLADHLAMTTQPPASVAAGAGFGLTVMARDAQGNIDSSFNGQIQLSLLSGPGAFAPVTVNAVNGVAVFDGLNFGATGPYQLQAVVKSGGALASANTSTFSVVAATAGVGSYYPATTDQSLRNAINAANASGFSTNTIYLEAGIYTLTNSGLGQLVLQNSSALANKTIAIVGQGPGQTIVEPSTAKGFNDRVFEVLSSAGKSVTVVFQNLTIAGGHASNDGGVGGGAALGGGLLVRGGSVELSNVHLSGNVAGGNVGAAGGLAGKGKPGTNGGKGANGRGGGLYLAGGKLSFKNATIARNIAWGGWGGIGGTGGLGSGHGALGGQGGSASGGGGYVAAGTVTGSSALFDSNAAFGGRGGSGGIGGTGTKGIGGAGGNGGPGGGVAGGALFVAGGSISLNSSQFDRAWAQAGDGGWGGAPGPTKAVTSKATQVGALVSNAGHAGNGGSARGLGVFLQGGALALSSGVVGQEYGLPGAGGLSGTALFSGTASANRGAAGTIVGGGMYLAAGKLAIAGLVVSGNQAAIGGGIYNATAAKISGTGLDVSGNRASGAGGGVYNLGAVQAGGQFRDNHAASGGGIYNVGRAGNPNLGVLGLSSASFKSNSASAGPGGAIANFSGRMHATNLVLVQNRASTKGGGIYSLKGALTIKGASSIKDNTVTGASGSGGGLALTSGSAVFSSGSIAGNRAANGGGVANNGTLAINNGGSIQGNTATLSGGGVYNLGSLAINGGSVSTNTATGQGGGVANNGTLALQNAEFLDNAADAGGGVYNNRTVTVQGSTFTGNTATSAGGGVNNFGTLTISGLVLQQNSAANGGGLYNNPGGQVNAAGLTIASNKAKTGDGGGVYNQQGTLSITQGAFTANSAASASGAGGLGGALFLSGGNANVAGGTSGAATIASNAAVNGGGVYLNNGSLTLSLLPLENNTASGSGGAVYVAAGGNLVLSSEVVQGNSAGVAGGGVASAGRAAIVNTVMAGNRATGAGGAVWVTSIGAATIITSTISGGAAAQGGDIANSGILTINASTISGGAATASGGGIANGAAGTLNLINSTIAGNAAGASGGGVFSRGTLTAVNATIAGNSASGAGGTGGLNVGAGAAALFNTIVASNTNGGSASDVAGTLAAGSSNDLIGTGGSGGLVNGQNGNLVGIANPGLGALADNGGPTWTMALLAGSPAIDAGANTFPAQLVPTTDERGALRGGQPQSLNAGALVDIGAYEASSSYLITSAADSSTNGGSLRAGLDWAAQSTNNNPANLASPAPNTLFFDTNGTFSSAQTINLLHGPLVLQSTTGQGVAIVGPGNGVVTVNAQNRSRDFVVPSGQSATLQGITIIGGLATSGPGGAVWSQGALALVNTIVSANTAASGGGVSSTGPLTINGGSFSNNTATTGDGGAINSTGPLAINGAVIKNNKAAGDGGGVARSSGATGAVALTGATFASNSATGSGGGLYLGAGAATIIGGSFSQNSAANGDGGAIDLAGNNTATINGAMLSNNSAPRGVGGAINNLGTLSASGLNLGGNSAGSGGALSNQGQAGIAASTISGNSAAGNGGGVNNAGTLTIDGTTISANTDAGGQGGGVNSGGTLTMTNSSLYGNTAPHGGAVSNLGGTASLTNVTIANNTATTGGGGIDNRQGALTAINVTIANNTAGASGTGGGIDNTGGTATLYNTIVDLNSAAAPGGDVAGTLAAGSSNNLIGVANPGLGALANNGGPTWTMALLAGSPAIDAGANAINGQAVPVVDQRGADRGPAGLNAGANVDIGAYEATSSFQVVGAGDANTFGNLRAAVAWANASFNANPANLAPNASAPNTIVLNSADHVVLSPALGPLVLSNATTAEAIVNQSGGTVAIDGGGKVGVLRVAPAVTASLVGVEITGGAAAAGAGINNAGTLALKAVLVAGNAATQDGGGAFNSGTLVLDAATTFRNNTSGRNGGAIISSGPLTINGSSFGGNTARAGGGAIYIGAGTAAITAAGFTGNTASTGDGGAIDLAGGGVTIIGGGFSGNAAAGNGGAINNLGTLSASGLNLGGNSAANGGALSNQGQAGIAASTISGNSASGNGGGVNNNGTLAIDGTTISANADAGGQGGGVNSGGTLTMTNSTLSGNAAPRGGALSNFSGTAALTNVTIAGNAATAGGAGIDNRLGALALVNVTISANRVGMSGTGGGLDNTNGEAAIYNTIVAGNSTGSGAASDVAGTLSVQSTNDLIGAGGAGGLVNGDQGNIVGVKAANLGLGALADNGGPTWTMALLAGSPAIDAGTSAIGGMVVPKTDQRGGQRGAAGLHAGASYDIGAYEATSSYLVTSTADTLSQGSLRSGVEWASVSTNANPSNLAPNAPAPNTLGFDSSGAFATPRTIVLSAAFGPLELSSTQTPMAIDGTTSSGLTISGGGAVGLVAVASGTTATLSGLTFANGSALAGGAVQNLGTLAIAYSTFQGNSASGNGGAVDNQGTLGISGSTFVGNSARGQGGAVFNEASGVLSLANDTLTANSGLEGGGVYNLGALSATCVTIAGNAAGAAGSGGGVNNASGGTATLYNSIVSTNTSAGGASDDVAGDFSPSSANNLIAVADPGLGALANNGGPTQTMALLAGSPALGAGNAGLAGTPGTDQRGALRGGGVSPSAIDIGAYELSSSYLVTTAADSLVPGTLRSAIDWAGSNTSSTPFAIRFDTNGVFQSPQTITLGLGTLALANTTTPIDIIGPGYNASNTPIVTISGGGAVGAFSVASGATASFSGLAIANGAAAGSGGAIDNAGTLTILNVAFSNDTAAAGSGGAVNNVGTLAISGSTFANNSAAYYGGAIFNNGGSASIAGSAFSGNTAQYGQGGSIDNLRGTLAIVGTTFQGGAAFQGGAVFNRSGTASIDTSTFSGGYAYQGGAIFNDGTATAPGTFAIANSTLAGNSAFQGGAVANNFNGVMTITNSTLANNVSYQYGGAVNSVATLTLICDTIAYNNVVAGGVAGGLDTALGQTAIYDSIIVLNTIGAGSTIAASDVVGSVTSDSAYNMVGGGMVNGVNNNIVAPKNPGLAAGLANNGGPTQTIALLAGSPALGAGSATIPGVAVPTTDQTGQPRPAGKFDIGAYESALSPSSGSGSGSGTSGSTGGGTSGNGTSATSALFARANPGGASSPAAIAPAASQPGTSAAAPLVVTGPAPFRGRRPHAGRRRHPRPTPRPTAQASRPRPRGHHAIHTVALPGRASIAIPAHRRHRPA